MGLDKTDVLIKRRVLDTETRSGGMPYEREGKGTSDSSRSHEHQRLPAKDQKPGGGLEKTLSHSL